MVHWVLILNILRHLFKNKETCTPDQLCVLMSFLDEILRSTFSYVYTTNTGQGVVYVKSLLLFFKYCSMFCFNVVNHSYMHLLELFSIWLAGFIFNIYSAISFYL